MYGNKTKKSTPLIFKSDNIAQNLKELKFNLKSLISENENLKSLHFFYKDKLLVYKKSISSKVLDYYSFLDEENKDINNRIKNKSKEIENIKAQIESFQNQFEYIIFGENNISNKHNPIQKQKIDIFILNYKILEKECQILNIENIFKENSCKNSSSYNTFNNTNNTQTSGNTGESFSLDPMGSLRVYDDLLKNLRNKYARLSRQMNSIIKHNNDLKKEIEQYENNSSNTNNYNKSPNSNLHNTSTNDKTGKSSSDNNINSQSQSKSNTSNTNKYTKKINNLMKESTEKSFIIKNLKAEILALEKSNVNIDKEIINTNEKLSTKFSTIIELEGNIKKLRHKAQTYRDEI